MIGGDPNAAAAANAIAGGRSLWSNILGLNNLKLQQNEQGMEKQRTSSELESADIARQVAKQGLQLGAVNLQNAQKQQHLQSFNPIPGAQNAVDTQAMQNVKPVDTSNPDTAGMKDFVEFPTPTNDADLNKFGIPHEADGSTQLPPVWRMPRAAYLKAVSPDLSSTPYDQLPSNAQQAIRDQYKANAPTGSTVSDAEAVQAYRNQQLGQLPPINIQTMGVAPSKMTIGPGGASAEYYPGGGVDPAMFKDFGQPLADVLSKNEELKTAMAKSLHVKNVFSYADDPHPSLASDKSLIMSYLKTIDPTVRVSEGTIGTVMDGMGLPEEIQNAAHKVLTGSQFTPEHRAWFKTAASNNLENARQSAATSLQSQLSIAGATGNPFAGNVKLPTDVLPPGQARVTQPESGGSRAAGSETPATAGNENLGATSQRFPSEKAALAANLPPGIYKVFDPSTGRYRSWTPPTAPIK